MEITICNSAVKQIEIENKFIEVHHELRPVQYIGQKLTQKQAVLLQPRVVLLSLVVPVSRLHRTYRTLSTFVPRSFLADSQLIASGKTCHHI